MMPSRQFSQFESPRQLTRQVGGTRNEGGRPRKVGILLAAVVAPALIVAGAAAGFAATHPRHQPPPAATGPNPNCTLVVPANALTAQGLATPYQLTATDPRAGACHEAVADQAAFVEASVFDPATNKISVYHPLVIDQGTQAAAAPVVPTLPAGAVVGIWYGYNGDVLTLRGATPTALSGATCVNGLPGNPFGQYAYCNAVAFFKAANAAVAAKTLVIAAAQTGKDGLPCPTVRDFAMIDQDQSDNVVSAYLVTANGTTAQFTAANQAKLAGSTKMTNGSDNGLLDNLLDPALGCAPLGAPELEDPAVMSSSLALNELSAAAWQQAPVATVPTADPMTLTANGAVSVQKANLYRAGVDQPALAAGTNDGAAYCTNMLNIQPKRLLTDEAMLKAAPSPDPANPDLFAFLTTRLQGSFDNLGCATLLNMANPIQIADNGDTFSINTNPGTGAASAAPSPSPAPTNPMHRRGRHRW
jgi:hypothetical protein